MLVVVLLFQNTQLVTLRKDVHLVGVAQHIDNIVGLKLGFGCDSDLLLIAEYAFAFAANLEDSHAEAAVDVKVDDRAAFKQAVGACFLETEDKILDVVLREQARQCALFALLHAFAAFFGKKEFAEGIEEDGADHEADETDGQEIEESEFWFALFGQIVAHDKVGRRTNKGEHATERTCESQRHH